ncbi:Non-specific serine/threonine protein kinase [Purpureocillium takamizusanense]|uniref:non-specific serine/threonine protein kinase n=1 Tax=Purpureocillium takamizusanense TaxID=2060973 RepID=A0A9Q8QSV1_9HYPO|nr:Non-specific serine/threonine protein kinase [Purpureocillium takamizusanense]UNI24196.1 Non-specific serine/threonine protein kinase [Purpureocillium takamizusanense]
MAEVGGAKVRSPLAETTNRINSPFPLLEPQPRGKPRPDHAEARPAHAQAHVQTQAQARRTVPNPMAENSRPSTSHGATNAHAPAVLSPPKQADEDKRFSQASYASSSSSRSKRSYKTHVGPWQLGRTLGKGSSARVRLCRHNVTKQLAAVKIVNRRMAYLVQDSSLAALSKWDSSLPEQINGEMRVPMAIEREVAILKLIEHPNIMRLYDIWENRSEIYLILEYIDRGDLFTFINTYGRLSEDTSVFFFRQMISAIAYCHSFNVCHRDLKPENILITGDLQIKIADFGMAALHQTDTHHLATACGSPHYAAPELLKNRQYRGDRADIWSLGVILYAMLSATLPFDDPDLRVMMAKTKKGHYQMPRCVSPEAADLIRRMLQVNPDRRITLKEIWRHPLVQKYNSLDSFGDITGQLPDTRKGFQYTPVQRSEIDPQLLRQLRSMWHMFSEQDLVLKLSCDEPNDQKAFYWLLYNYRDKQLEDFKPELAHSMSDYHHLKPTIWKKKVSTCEFAQPRGKGHGRSVSRFTVISNAAETESGTEKSYDPYRGSRMLQGCEPEASHAKIVIHRDAETVSVRSTTRARSGSTTARRARANSARAASIMAKQPSRGSLLSLRSNRQGTPHVAIPALRHKRGVDFSHIRRRSTSAGYAKRQPTRLRTTASVAGDGSMYQKEAARSPSPELRRQADGTHPKAKGAPKNGASMIFNEELRHFSNSCAKDCDEAFKGTLAEAESAGGSWTDAEKKGRGSTPFSITVDSPTVTTPATDRSSAASWQSRPLPPLPPEEPSKQFLTPSLRDVESELDFGGEENNDAATVSHDGPHLAVPVMLSKHADRRVVSAPAHNHQPSRKLTTLPSIHENTTSAVDSDGTRVVSAPPHGSGKRSDDMDRSLEYLSKVENTIRVVHSPGSTSPVKMPEPLNVQKKSATEDFGHKLHRRLAYNAEKYDDDAVERPAADTGADTKKKKTSWFRRVSKAESASAASEPKTARTSIASKQSSDADGLAPAAKKKAFTFPFWKSNKERETGMIVEGPVRATEDKMAARQTRQQALRDSGSGSIRNVAVKQNWLTRLFRVKPATTYICMTLSRKRARQEVGILLREWRRYGMKGVQVDKQRNIVFARLGAKNCKCTTTFFEPGHVC